MNLVYWATIEHYRWWLTADGVRFKAVNGQKMTGDALRSIAVDYRVSRGIRSGKEGGLANLVNKYCEKWPEALMDKADACAKLAKEAGTKNITRGHLASAATKLMWFMQPRGWTMYDRFAADGLEVPKNADSIARMKTFYEALEEKGFLKEEDIADSIIKDTAFGDLRGSRVIDKFLMLRGFDVGRCVSTVRDCGYFLEVLPPAIRQDLENLASAMAKRFASGFVKMPVDRRVS